jgi:thioredoxin reductase (NADPH)
MESHSSVVEAKGETSLEAIAIDTVGEVKIVPATSLFIFIGAVLCTEWLAGNVECDERGFVVTGSDLKSGDYLR